ncbi:DUF3726 domain-containing protein [Spartinivicinus ruber]|uniref:DUF3726 domain-containing protein n=1 Tax=Spartinivicinus ruber TaxID=2683272 RepID=UPI001CA4437D|nr:DUF3726 domain-containing protein [Spartinivicinus ruber]
MQVSHNELVTLCEKAFSGFQRHCGEPNIIANMVVDLEMVGLNGIQHFVKALTFLQNDSDLPPQVGSSSPSQLVANLRDSSILGYLPILLDYAQEQLVNKNSITLSIEHCHNRWLAFGALNSLSNQGLSIKASWSNGSHPQHVMYLIPPSNQLPEIYISDTPKDCLHSLTIEVSKKPFQPPHPEEYDQNITAEQLNSAKQHAWVNGITVNEPDWNTLKQHAKAMLVATNEQSKLGAGERVI